MKKLKIGSLYEVDWNDAYGSLGWREGSYWTSVQASVCKTVGYYLGKNQAGDLVFASTSSTDDSYNGISGRPKAMITAIRELKAGKNVYRSK